MREQEPLTESPVADSAVAGTSIKQSQTDESDQELESLPVDATDSELDDQRDYPIESNDSSADSTESAGDAGGETDSSSEQQEMKVRDLRIERDGTPIKETKPSGPVAIDQSEGSSAADTSRRNAHRTSTSR